MRNILSLLAAITLTLLAYKFTIGADKPQPAAESGGCCIMSTASPAASQPATAPSEKLIDVKNTKCIVTEEDVSNATFVYEGKIYHVCCSGCEKDFRKDPQKYLKALAEHPEKYGIK